MAHQNTPSFDGNHIIAFPEKRNVSGLQLDNKPNGARAKHNRSVHFSSSYEISISECLSEKETKEK